MKKIFAVLLTILLLICVTGCGSKKTANIPTDRSVSVLPEHLTLEETDAWPESRFTEGIPKPAGAVDWIITDEDSSICGIGICGLDKEHFERFQKDLKAAGFVKISKVEKSESGEEYVSAGTVYSDGNRSVSLAYSVANLMLSISMEGVEQAENHFLKPSHMTNIHVNSYATYDEKDGIQVTAEMYVPESEKIKPQFTEVDGVATIRLGDQVTNLYFGASADSSEVIGAALKTGIVGTSGEKGSVTMRGVARSENAVAGAGSFTVTYSITIP